MVKVCGVTVGDAAGAKLGAKPIDWFGEHGNHPASFPMPRIHWGLVG